MAWDQVEHSNDRDVMGSAMTQAPAVTASGREGTSEALATERQPRSPGRLRSLSPTRISAIYLWVIFILLFGLLAPSTFLTGTTFRLVFAEGVVTCVLALAFLIPLAAGAYDLSIGAVMATSLAIAVYLNIHSGLPMALVAIVAVLAGGLAGALNGFIIVKLRVSSFIATLGVSQVLFALVLLISNNRQLVAAFPSSWEKLGQSNVAGIPVAIFYLVLIALVIWYVLEYTRVGRYLFATGGNAEAARLSGVRTDRLVWGAFIASGVVAGLAGVIYSMRTGLFSAETGPGYLFPAVAAVFLGASQFSRRPNVWGTLIAYYALAFGVQGLTLSASGAAVWSQPLFQGVSVIVAVALASRPAVRKLRARRDPESDGLDADKPATATT
jgi:ribose transport system permease protein